tara:strand:- start:9103 stop:10857 length:1755 start_codon:yes stop_codon:yes gene_type:complete
MALQYRVNRGAAAVQDQKNYLARQDKMMNRMADEQRQKDAQERQLVKDADAFTNNFYQEYGKIPQSANTAITNATRTWAMGAAKEENELYTKAYGSEGNVENRLKLKELQLKHIQQAQQLATWVGISDSETTAISENTAAVNQGTSLNAFTRGNDDKRLGFQQDLTQDKFANVNITSLENGQLVMSGYDKDGILLRDRNLSADVADQQAGNGWYDAIGEEDLLGKVLGDKWNNKENGLSQIYTPKKRTKTVYDADGGSHTEIIEESVDKGFVYEDLLDNQANLLDVTIKSPKFDKIWDQLYTGRYIKDTKGDPMVEGEIAWSTVKKISTMDDKSFEEFATQTLGYKDADIDKSGSIDQGDKDAILTRMKEAGRIGLANYYADQMAPQSTRIIDTKDVDKSRIEKGGSDDGSFTPAQKLAMGGQKPIWDNIHNKAPELFKIQDPLKRAQATADFLNDGNFVPEDDFGSPEFYTGAQLNEMNKDRKKYKPKDPEAIYETARLTPGGKRKVKKKVFSSTFMQGDNLKDWELKLDHAANLNDSYSNYFSKNVKQPVKVYNTKEEAEKANPGKKIIVGTGKNKGKFIVK